MIHARKGMTLTGEIGVRARAICVFCLVLVALALMARSGHAQETAPPVFDLRGVVVDDAGQPLVGAFVALDGSEWGSLTDDSGRFRLPDILAGRIQLTVEQLGYETLSWSGQVGADSGEVVLSLEAKPLLLEGLTVVTDRFRARRNATATTVLTYDQRQLATAPQTTITEFVASRAGLTSVGCPIGTHASLCLWSRGRLVVPSVWVDEVPVIGGMDYLESFRPHDLYMVEVYARGRHIRAYTHHFMERAAKQRLRPIALLF